MSNAEPLIEALATVFAGDDTRLDEATVDRMIAVLAPITSDDIVTVMAGPGGMFAGTYPGREGMHQAWADWLEGFTGSGSRSRASSRSATTCSRSRARLESAGTGESRSSSRAPPCGSSAKG